MNPIYLDNSATTPLCDEAKARIREVMDAYGNPSSLHAPGRAAQKILSDARDTVARTLGLRSVAPGELVFTSCGSEADSLALFGTAHAKARRTANRIVTTDAEHPAVENVMQQLEREDWEVVRLSTRGGVLDPDELDRALTNRTFLVSLMMVNNETGALYDLKNVFSLARARNPEVITHTDAVQGYLKCRFTPAALGADLISLSAHKIHGPKGVGALYVNPALIRSKKITPFLLGGGQENGLRSGTENILGIAAFAAAAEAGYRTLDADVERMRTLRREAIDALIPLGIKVKEPVGACAPHILNLTLPDLKSETMLHFLDARGICVSSGSACSSHARHVSRSLLAFGASEREADCSLRVSISRFTAKEELDALVAALREGLETLIRIRK